MTKTEQIANEVMKILNGFELIDIDTKNKTFTLECPNNDDFDRENANSPWKVRVRSNTSAEVRDNKNHILGFGRGKDMVNGICDVINNRYEKFFNHHIKKQAHAELGDYLVLDLSGTGFELLRKTTTENNVICTIINNRKYKFDIAASLKERKVILTDQTGNLGHEFDLANPKIEDEIRSWIMQA